MNGSGDRPREERASRSAAETLTSSPKSRADIRKAAHGTSKAQAPSDSYELIVVCQEQSRLRAETQLELDCQIVELVSQSRERLSRSRELLLRTALSRVPFGLWGAAR